MNSMISMTRDNIIIERVKIDVGGSEIKEVEIGSRGVDILNHPAVQRWLEDHPGEIVQVEGRMKYEDRWFNFLVGYNNDGFGTIRVKKKGSLTGDVEIVEDAFFLLYQVFHAHFINEGV